MLGLFAFGLVIISIHDHPVPGDLKIKRMMVLQSPSSGIVFIPVLTRYRYQASPLFQRS
jgi:hypothetical protein